MLAQTMLMTALDHDRARFDQLLALAETLGDAQLADPIESNERSVRETLLHWASVMRGWRTVLETHLPPAAYRAPIGEKPSLAELRTFAADEAAALRRWLAAQTDESLATPFTLIWQGQETSVTPWHAVMQVILHGAQHRSEIALTLTRLGKSPGDLDFIFWVDRA